MIRHANHSDFAAITAIYNQSINSPLDWANCDVAPLSVRQQRAYLGQAPLYVHKSDGLINGFAVIKPFSARPNFPRIGELAVYVHAASKSRLVGGRLAAHAVRQAENLGYQSLIAIILEKNSSSIRGVEALGFVHRVTLHEVARKRGEWINVLWYERQLGIKHPLTTWLATSQKCKLTH